MIRSRHATIALAAVAGFVSAVPSAWLGSTAILAGTQNGHAADYAQILVSFLLPPTLLITPIVVLSWRRTRLLGVGVGLASAFAGLILLYVGLEVMKASLMQEVEYANATGAPVVIYWAREGEDLSRSQRLNPGEIRKRATPIYREGRWLRIVAVAVSGSEEDYRALPWSLPPDGPQLADRTLFDRTFTWAELRQLGNHVTIDHGDGPL